MGKKFLVFSLIIVLVGAIPRAIELINGNYLFGYDQGVFFLAVKSMVIDHKLTLIGAPVGGQGGFFQGPGWYYLLSIPFALSGGNPYSGMVLMFLIGMATIAAAIFSLRKMFDKRASLMGGLLIAISPAMIIQSRFIWPPFPISFLSVLLLFFLCQVLQKKERYLPFLTFTLGLMTHFETATAATLLINLLLVSPVLFYKKLVSFKIILISLGAMVLTQLPLILFDLRHNLLNIQGIVRLILEPSLARPPFGEIWANQWNVFKENLLITFPSANLWWPLLLLIIIGGVFTYMRDRKPSFGEKAFIIYLVISPISLFLIFLRYGSGIWSWWILELNVYYCFLLGIILSYFWQRKFLRLPIFGLLLLLTLSFASQTLNFYKNDFNDFGGVHKIKGKIQALEYIYQDAKGKPFNLLVFTPPIYTYAYDYLNWWYSQKKYHYLPKNDKSGTFYLLIEPDPHQPWTYKGWLETVIKTGKIIETKELTSGFIIQKRIEE